MKKFELSAYGVEEMNEQEMVYVNGGATLIAPIVVGAVKLILAVIGAVSGAVSAYCAWQVYNDRPNPGDTSRLEITGRNNTPDTMHIQVSGAFSGAISIAPGQSGTFSVMIVQPQ